jgi:hypothetical protein
MCLVTGICMEVLDERRSPGYFYREPVADNRSLSAVPSGEMC